MALNKKLIHFKTEENFLKQKEANNIKDTSIIFIKDAKKIYTHGEEYKTVTWGKIEPEVEYVDLGLPSGLLWAACNLGANSPEESGLYFHWAGTEGITAEQAITDDYYKTWAIWENTPYSEGTGTSDSNAKLTKYCNDATYGNDGFTDNLTVLLPEDDAVNIIIGQGWRMPTKDEFIELFRNANQRWVANYNGTGINGVLFKGKNEYSDNELFIPASGRVDSSGLYYASIYGGLWASTLDTYKPDCGSYLLIDNSGGAAPGSSHSRFNGFPIRGVKSKS